MKQILKKEFPPTSPVLVSHSESYKYFTKVGGMLEKAGYWEKIADDDFVDPFAFRPNNLAVYNHIHGVPGAIVLKVERTIKPYGNHEHDYFTVYISTSEANIGELEKEVLSALPRTEN